MFALSLIPAFFVLLFLYSFSSILCFAVEDYFPTLCNKLIFLIGDNYWHCMSMMIVSSLAIVGCLFVFKTKGTRGIENSKKNLFSSLPFFAIVCAVVVHISQILSNYFEGNAGYSDLMFLFINIMAVLLYIAFGYFEHNRADSNNPKLYGAAIIASLILCLVTAFCFCSNYMPRDIIYSLKRDSETLKKVENFVNSFNKGGEITDLPDGIEFKSVDKNKKVVSWNMVTDFEKIKVTTRLKNKFNYPNLFPEKSYNRGKNERTIVQGKN